MRDGLDEIARAKPAVLYELENELKKTQQAVSRLRNRQQQLLAEIKSFHEEAKQNLRDARKFGANGLQQIQNRGGVVAGAYLMGESLPTEFYLRTADRIEQRLVGCIHAARELSQQLSATMSAVNGDIGRITQPQYEYGQASRIGTREIVALIKQQGEAFSRVAATVAGVHEQAEELRAMYLATHLNEPDPFEAANREEAAKVRIETQRLRAAEASAMNGIPGLAQQQQYLGQQQQQLMQAGVVANPMGQFTTPGGGAGTNGFNTPGAAPSSAGFGGFGGFGGGFGSTSTAPAGGAAGTGFGASAFGAPAGAGTGGVSTGFGGFGLPAAGASGGASSGAFGSGLGLGLGATGSNTAGFGGAGGFGGMGFKALDLATTTTTNSSAFGAAAGSSQFGGFSSASKKSSKNRK
jgi:hypothetical protein